MSEFKGATRQFAGAGFIHRVAKLIQPMLKINYADAKTKANNLLGQEVIVMLDELPTADPGVTNQIWNNAGTPAKSA